MLPALPRRNRESFEIGLVLGGNFAGSFSPASEFASCTLPVAANRRENALLNRLSGLGIDGTGEDRSFIILPMLVLMNGDEVPRFPQLNWR